MRNFSINILALSLIILLFANFQSKAQSIHVIGNGTTESTYPPNTQVFDYNWSSMMYTSEEMGESKTITKIGYDQTTDYAGYWEYAVLPNQKIYMKMTDDVSFGTLAYEDPSNPDNGYTLVYDGTIQFNLSWTELDLISDFEYDGSKSLIIHWENHRGTSAPIINVKFNSTGISNNVFKALGGDAEFPTAFGTFILDRPNVAIYYQSDAPANPVNPMPANNSYKALLHTDLEFVIGENTSSYDLYFGTNNPPTTLLVADASVSSPGTYNFNPSAILGDLLDDHTRYFWKVIAKDGASTAESQTWTFLTQGIIDQFPYETSFEDQPINPLYADTIDWSWPLAGTANWRMIDYDAVTDIYAIACNAWSASTGSYSLISPRILLEDNQRISFYWKIDGSDGSHINAYFDITSDGGENWQTLNEFIIDGEMSEWEQYYIDLNIISGDNCYVRWRYETLVEYTAEHFKIDDLKIEATPDGAYIVIDEPLVEFPALSVGASTYLPIEVRNSGTENLVISGSTLTAPYSIAAPITIAPGAVDEVLIMIDPTSEGDFSDTFEFTGDFDGEATFNISAIAYQVDYNFFENADASNNLPEYWNVIRTLDPFDSFTDVTVVSTNYDSYSQPNAFKMQKMNDVISPLMLVTRGVSGYPSNGLTFYAKKSYDDYDATLQIGLTDDPLHPEAFQLIETIETTTTHQLYEVEFPSDTDLPYIVFNFVDGEYAATIWLDDIQWDNQGAYPPYCPVTVFPAEDAVDVDIMMGMELKWTSGGGNPTGYKLSVGTDANASNIIDGVDVGNVITYDFPIDPVYGQYYYWKVTAYNAYGESVGCGIKSFLTMHDPVKGVPFSENFDEMDAFGERLCPLGWSVENANTDNFPWDVISDVATPGMAHSTPNAMHMLFSLNQMDDYLFTPPVFLFGGVGYTMTFWYRTMGDQWVPDPTEKLKVLMGTTNSSSAMLIELYDNNSLDNQDWYSETITFTPPETDQYHFAFYGYSSPNEGILLIDDVEIDYLTAISESNEFTIDIYPNPAKNLVKIESQIDIQTIELIDIQSRVIYQADDINNDMINLESYESGTYFLKFYMKNDIKVKKLIIQ